jgi:glycosyltransferase involved in cell wall biosynthesis
MISIVVPLYNEAESLPHLLQAIDSSLAGESFEVVFVDDGSTDSSFEVCRGLHAEFPGRVKVIRFSRNYGKAAALSEGIKAAEGDIIVTMDADLQDDPVAIPGMVEKINEGWDIVSGWKKKRYDPIFSKNLPSKFFNTVTSLASGLHLHDFNCGFKAYRAEAAKSLDIYGERHRYLPVLGHWDGFKVTEMVVPHHPRKFGHTKYGWSRFIAGPFDLLTLMFLRTYLKRPLHLFGLLGLFLSLIGCGILGYFGVQWAITGEMRIRPLTLLSLGAIIMGIQFISMGLLGELIINVSPERIYKIREKLE